MGADLSTEQAKSSDKQREVTISKEKFADKDVDTVQGFVRHHLKASPMDSDLVMTREAMDLILFFFALPDGLKMSTNYRIVDVVYNDAGATTETALKCQVSVPEALKVKLSGNDLLIAATATFVRGLSQNAKHQIWGNVVQVRGQDGTQVLDATVRFDQVEQLLFEMVMVYVNFMEQSGVSVTPKKVRKQVASLAKYIYTKYHPLRRQKFEGEEMYFSRMLNNYVSAKRSGVIHGGVGYRLRC